MRSRVGRILIASLPLAAGCATWARITAPSLEGSPETTGIVVIEPDITFLENILGAPYGERLIGGAITRAGDSNEVVSGRPTSGLVVFSNLAPGAWRLSLIEGQLERATNLPPEHTRWRKHYELPPESAGDFTFEVRAGEVVYAAVEIVDDDQAESRGVRFRRHDHPIAEEKAWRRMEELYGNSGWAPAFRAKLGASAARAEPATAPKSGSKE